MIDYYYEFPEGLSLLGKPMRYGLQRGFHPEECRSSERLIHNQCYQQAQRIWIENANGATLVKRHGRDVHEKVSAKELTWIKLQAHEIEV